LTISIKDGDILTLVFTFHFHLAPTYIIILFIYNILLMKNSVKWESFITVVSN